MGEQLMIWPWHIDLDTIGSVLHADGSLTENNGFHVLYVWRSSIPKCIYYDSKSGNISAASI